MRNSLGRFFLVFLIGVLSFGIVHSDVNFSSRDSGFFVLDGGRFHVQSPNFTVQGALGLSRSAELSGENIKFSSGTLNRENTQASFSGEYSVADNGRILLGGKNALYAQAGSVLAGVQVEGKGNIIEGAPLLADSIVLKDAQSELFLGLHNKLTQDLYLNGGTLILTNDLSLGDNVKIIGPGTIKMQNRRLYIGGFAKSTWSTDLNFHDGADIVLNNDLAVQGTWRFQGFSTINGNGNLLDVTSGSLTCSDHRNSGVLSLIDVAVQGIGQKSIVMTRPFLQFDSDVDFTAGKVMIDGPSSFILGSSGVVFKDAAILNVESQLILDVRTHEGMRSGSLDAGGNIFSGGKINASSLGSALTSGRFVLKNGGLIDNAGATSRSKLGRLSTSHSKVALGAPDGSKKVGKVSGKVNKVTTPRPQPVLEGIEASVFVDAPVFADAPVIAASDIGNIITAEGSGDEIQGDVPRLAPREEQEVISVEGVDVAPEVESGVEGVVETEKVTGVTNPFNVIYASEPDDLEPVENDGVGIDQFEAPVPAHVDRISTTPDQLKPTGNLAAGTTFAFDSGRVFVMNDEPIAITQDNITLDGRGCALEFVGADSGKADATLFNVDAGKTVTLRNITLTNVTQSTFNVADGATIVLGENVTIEFGDDVVFMTGLFQVTAPARFRGMNGSKKVVFLPAAGVSTMMDLGVNSLKLQDINLVGLPFVTSETTGSIVLGGDAMVEVDGSTAMNFDIEGTGNALVLRQNGLTLSGAVRFGSMASVNELGIRFVLPLEQISSDPISVTGADGNVGLVPLEHGNPLVIFGGSMVLASDFAAAEVVFEDPSVRVMNVSVDAFVIGDNSTLTAKNMEVLGHPIMQNSGRFTSNVVSVSGTGVDQSQGRALHPSYQQAVTTYGKLAQQKAKKRAQVKAKKIRKGKRTLHRGMDFLDDEDEAFYGTRSFGQTLATGYVVRELHSTTIAVGPASNAAMYDGATRRNFSTGAVPFAVTLKDGATLEQNPAKTIALDADHSVGVVGKRNRIVVTHDCMINAAGLMFGEDAMVTFEFDKQSSHEPMVHLSGLATLPAGSGIMFKGPGRVVLADGVGIFLNGSSDRQAFVNVGQGVRVENMGATFVGGVGAFSIAGGMVALTDGVFTLGDLPESPVTLHDIQFSVTDGGILDLSGSAYMRCAGGAAVSFGVSRRASLTLDTGCTLAFNEGKDGMVQRGWLRALTFSYATVAVRGMMKFGPNRHDDDYVDATTDVAVGNSSIGGGGSFEVMTQNALKPEVVGTQKFVLADRQPVDAATRAQGIKIGTIGQYLS